MKAAAFTICALIISVLLGFLFHGFSAGLDAEQAREDKKAQDWLTFSMQHHCKVSKPSSFSDPNVTWNCDGFEVRR